MTKFPQADYLSDYEEAITKIESHPKNLDFKHKAVLALARMGSLDFALREFKRYGLDQVRSHEDIMALDGRLSKDLHLVTTGKTALNHARDAAEKYEAAFQDTRGYYSGVNAATMALLANMPWDIIKARINIILDILPSTESLTPEDHYFIEATRAECLLLLGEVAQAQDALRGAINFDPLNYTAHATTLKQFALILDKRQESKTWLTRFRPPLAAHFAGHLWKHIENSHENLPEMISNLVQHNDIGFGYGALAAGADILFAEALLEEGAELNVILPCNIDSFASHSVKPYGENWIARFHACLDQASSVICLPNSDRVDMADIILSARVAMGQAILRGHQLEVAPVQMLLLDLDRTNSLTQLHQMDWKGAELECFEIAFDSKVLPTSEIVAPLQNIGILLRDSNSSSLERYDTLETAIEYFKSAKSETAALHFDLAGSDRDLEIMMRHKFSGSILVSEALASYAALKFREKYKVTFAGTVSDGSVNPIRTYTLRVLG
jgi:tetratricopeptide (TPR) repeat protein